MTREPIKDDVIRFTDRNILGDNSTFVGRVMKIKPRRHLEIYLDRVVELKGVNSYVVIFDEISESSHKQTTLSNVQVNFGNVTKKGFIDEFPEYMI